MKNPSTILGKHLLIELSGCNQHHLNDINHIKQTMEHAAILSGATILNSWFHHFIPNGVSGMVIIAESHLSIHTWPEYGCALVDIFTCGESCDPYIGAEVVSELLDASWMEIRELVRGF